MAATYHDNAVRLEGAVARDCTTLLRTARDVTAVMIQRNSVQKRDPNTGC
jgi:hypothetical protein